MSFIGCDIEEISRFENKKDDREFLDIIFSELEQTYCFSHKHYAQHLAARYCGKEAVIKALYSAGIKGTVLSDIEITNNEDGVPMVKLLNDLHIDLSVQLSLSHCKHYAMAYAMVTFN